MSQRTHPNLTMCLGVGLATLSSLLVALTMAKAQAPVITDPGDLRVLSVNTTIAPLDQNLSWTPAAPMPTARAGFAIAAANNKIYAIGGAIGDDCNITGVVEAYDPMRDVWSTNLASFATTQLPDECWNLLILYQVRLIRTGLRCMTAR